MIDALTASRSGLLAASQRLEQTASNISKTGTNVPSSARTETVSTQPGVRVAYLPLPQTPDLSESMVTLVEAEHAYKANAIVLSTATDMLDALLEAAGTDKR